MGVLVENEDLKAKLANSVEKEVKILAELENMSAEKKILEQTILSEVEKRKRRSDFETLASKLKELMLGVFHPANPGDRRGELEAAAGGGHREGLGTWNSTLEEDGWILQGFLNGHPSNQLAFQTE